MSDNRIVIKRPMIVAKGFKLVKGAMPLHVNEQHQEIMVWHEINHDSMTRTIYCVPTGARVPLGGKYINTTILCGGELVYHFYYTEES